MITLRFNSKLTQCIDSTSLKKPQNTRCISTNRIHIQKTYKHTSHFPNTNANTNTRQIQMANTNNGVIGQVVTYCSAVGLQMSHFTNSAQVMANCCDQLHDDDCDVCFDYDEDVKLGCT